MKIRNFALALATTALLSTLVYASDNMDTISSENYMLVAMTANDPFVVALTTAGWNKADELHYRQ